MAEIGEQTMERQRLRERMNDPQLLDQRIAEALSANAITSAMLAALFGEVETAIAAAETAAAQAKTRALDPGIQDNEAARQQRDDCSFRLERLRAALAPLQQRYSAVRLAERRAQWRADYAQVKAKRDATATNLKDIYTEFTTKLIDALIAAKEVDPEVARINSTAPNGEHDRLLTVECWARGVTGVADNFSLMQLKLPSFEQPNAWAWPPPVPAIDVRQVVPAAMLTHPGANWPEALKQRDAARQQEAKRVANYYRQREREKEDIENARARAEQARRRQAAST
jgi:hypothetical protein